MSESVRKEIEQFTRGLLAERLVQITPPQRGKFDGIFPKGVVRVAGRNLMDDLVNAIDLCDRTIKKNVAETERVGE